MERQILQKLNWDVTVPTAFRFLERFSKLAKLDDKMSALALYMTELCMVDVNMNKWQPSLLASSTIYVAQSVTDVKNSWSDFMKQQTGYSLSDVR